MLGPSLIFLAGLVLGAVAGGAGIYYWQAKKPQRPEVRDAPLPQTGGTSDPFAQHWSQKLLEILDWRVFEDVVAAYIQQLGFTVKAKPVDAQGVLELHGFEAGSAKLAMIVRCKVWDRAQVDDKAVLALHEAMVAAQVKQGAYLTTGRFTPAAIAAVARYNIDLVHGGDLLERIGQLPLAVQNNLLDLATDGAYATPTCPSCHIKMTRRMTVVAGRPGVYFLGCRKYPQCRQIFPVG